jgi:hypothetical protein
MSSLQTKLKNRLSSLEEIDGVNVKVSEDMGTINISHRLHHVADFMFKWVDDNHYVGYFVGSDKLPSQAIVSIWEPLEAVRFIVLYFSLYELRARR